MKFRLAFGSKSNKYVVPSSPTKKEQHPTTQSSPAFTDFGSKEETFFESRPWLDSDCEDDFFSVNGDFTPSRGTTPVHHNFSTGTPRSIKSILGDKTPDYNPEPSPTDRKKRLSDLFQESSRDDQNNRDSANEKKMDPKPATIDLPPKSSNATPFVSGANSVCSSERTPNGVLKAENNKSLKSAQCCLPRLLSSRSFDDRKNRMTPAQSCG